MIPSFLRTSCVSPLSEVLGGMSLPLSLEIAATDISLDDNEGAVFKVGVGGGETKNANCSELGDENRGVASFEVFNSWEFDGPICAGRPRAHG